MAHKTLIGGTAYKISGGKTLVNGTAYSIYKGKTLVGGTAYEIGFVKELADCTPAEIQAMARSGQAANYWALGDSVPITLNGTVGALTFSNETYYASIIGFNHNSSIEGSNSIHFQLLKNSDGKDIAFVDGTYGRTGNSVGFRMNTSNSTSGGWAGSYMRNTICSAFLSTMPSAWRSVIAVCTKYTDNVGGKTNAASSVTATSDNIWLLSEFEAHGSIKYSNSAEQNYQKQYDYYKNGNSRVKYKHNDTATKCYWWMRSVRAGDGSYNCALYSNTTKTSRYSDYSLGFSPCFKVA